MLDNKLYKTVSLYHQVRSGPDKFGHLANRIAKGIEFESVHQYSNAFYVLASFTYQDDFRNGGTGAFQLNTDYYRLQANGSYKAPSAGVTTVP